MCSFFQPWDHGAKKSVTALAPFVLLLMKLFQLFALLGFLLKMLEDFVVGMPAVRSQVSASAVQW